MTDALPAAPNQTDDDTSWRATRFKPNGSELARAMAANVDVTVPGPVVELGPGTGAITKALTAGGVDPSRLVLIEADPNFCKLLSDRWPEARVLQADAYSSPSIMRSLGECPAAVVSSLPLLARPPLERFEFVLDCLDNAAPDAVFIQSTYFVRSPVPLDGSVLRGHGCPIIWRSVLPARVWTYHLAARKFDKRLRYSV